MDSIPFTKPSQYTNLGFFFYHIQKSDWVLVCPEQNCDVRKIILRPISCFIRLQLFTENLNPGLCYVNMLNLIVIKFISRLL